MSLELGPSSVIHHWVTNVLDTALSIEQSLGSVAHARMERLLHSWEGMS